MRNVECVAAAKGVRSRSQRGNAIPTLAAIVICNRKTINGARLPGATIRISHRARRLGFEVKSQPEASARATIGPQLSRADTSGHKEAGAVQLGP